MNADHSTCNGVVPHPTLPFFVSYGIDSTAKLWRATLPVDHRVDDSPQGRRRQAHEEEPYEPSAVVSSWKQVEDLMGDSDGEEDPPLLLLPDDVPRDPDILHRGMFSGLPPLFLLRRHHTANRRPPFIGNDLRQLPDVIRQNLFSAVHTRGEEDPIKSSLGDLKRRVSWIRLQFQTMERGLKLKDNPADCFEISSSSNSITDPADLIPSNPSDWLPYDDRFTNPPQEYGLDVAVNHSTAYQGFAFQRHGDVARSLLDRQERYERRRKADNCGTAEKSCQNTASDGSSAPMDKKAETDEEAEEGSNAIDHDATDDPMDAQKHDEAGELLYQTISVLKESGNKALQEGNIALAARRYDSALQYGAVALLSFLGKSSCRLKSQTEVEGWTPVRKLVVTVRLNLSMALLKPGPTNSNKLALDQAVQAIQELEPFLGPLGQGSDGSERAIGSNRGPEDGIKAENGVVCHTINGTSNGSTVQTNNDATPNHEAQELLVKAYYRCGTAQMRLGEYKDAIKAFEESLSQNAKSSSDQAIQRSLAEAKRKQAHRNKRQRKKYKEALFSST